MVVVKGYVWWWLKGMYGGVSSLWNRSALCILQHHLNYCKQWEAFNPNIITAQKRSNNSPTTKCSIVQLDESGQRRLREIAQYLNRQQEHSNILSIESPTFKSPLTVPHELTLITLPYTTLPYITLPYIVGEIVHDISGVCGVSQTGSQGRQA